MKENKKSALDTAIYLIKTYLPQKNSLSHKDNQKTKNRKLTITLGPWSKPYLKAIKQLRLIKY